MFSLIPPAARNYAWIVAISVVGLLVVGAACLWGALVYTGQQIPRELILVVSGVGTLLAQLSIAFLGRQARDNNQQAVKTQHELRNGVLEKTQESNELMKESARNVRHFNERLDILDKKLDQLLVKGE